MIAHLQKLTPAALFSDIRKRSSPRTLFFSFWITLSLIAIAAERSALAELLDRNVSQVIAFRVRDLLGKSPAIDPRLKIYAFDDQMVELVGREDLSLKEWGTLFRAFAEAGAAAIYIDKLFGTPDQLASELPAFEKLIKDFPIPLITAGWLSPQAIQGRVPLDPRASTLSLEALETTEQGLPSWLQNVREQAFYGPHILLHPYLRRVGHAIYRGQGEIDPLLRVGQDAFVPHWSLLGVHQLQATQEGLRLRNPDSFVHEIPLTRSHTLAVNFLPETRLRDSTYSLRKAYLRAQEGISFAQSLQKGQIVVILPAMFTGNTDMVASPIGYIPGGYVMSSLLNSHLTAHWLKPWNYPALSLILVVGLGVSLGFIVSPGIWLSSLLTGILVIAASSLSAFAYWSWVSNSLYHILAFSSASLVVFASLWQLRTLKARTEAAHRAAMQEAAQAVQEALLPIHREYKAFRYASYYRAAEATGGDWFGLYPNEDQSRLYVFIGDVTGHGFSSALLTGTVAGGLVSQIEACLRQPAPMEQELFAMAQFINSLVYATGSRTDRSLTMSFLGFDFKEGVLTYLNAGHPAPLLARSGKVQALAARSSILGMQPSFEGQCKHLPLMTGDCFLLFTDGLWENQGPKGEVLKPRQIWDVLKRRELTPDEQVAEILRLGRLQWKDFPPDDDCTFLVLQLHSWDKLTTPAQ